MRLISQNNFNDVAYDMHNLRISKIENNSTMIVAQNITGMEIPMGNYNNVDEAINILERVRQMKQKQNEYFKFPPKAVVEEKKEETVVNTSAPIFVDKKMNVPEKQKDTPITGSLEIEIGDITDEEI